MRILVAIPSRGLDGLLAVSLDHARRALDRCADRASGRIVVVDNASEVPYVAGDLPHADRVLRFDRHRSFSAAVNAAAASEPSDLLLLLNNDVLLHEDAIASMLDLLDDPLVAIVGTRLVFPEGTIQHCGVLFDEQGPYHDRWGERTRIVPRATRHLQCVTGAALLVRTPVWDALDGLDEAYPYGFEDVDLCLRARQLGHRIACAQVVDSIHFQSRTPGRQEFEAASLTVFLERWAGRFSVDSDPRMIRA
jgi:GT2 family glycosyltransferase